MDITATIAENLNAWMQASPTLDTIKRVAARSGVGFGTVRRARNGDGNTTIQNLAAIARAFGRSTEDLIRPTHYSQADNITRLSVQEPRTPPLMAELMAIAETISDRGQAELIGRAHEIARLHPRAKAKRRPS